jgi:hypothetical protein
MSASRFAIRFGGAGMGREYDTTIDETCARMSFHDSRDC